MIQLNLLERQPPRKLYYHKADLLFAATTDLSEALKQPKFKARLEAFIRWQLSKTVLVDSVDIDASYSIHGEPP